MKRAVRRRMKVPMGKARQLIKCVYGLRGDEHVTANLRLIHDDSTLMEMDAPVCIPTGAMKAYLGLDRKLLFVSEACFLRHDTEDERFRPEIGSSRA